MRQADYQSVAKTACRVALATALLGGCAHTSPSIGEDAGPRWVDGHSGAVISDDAAVARVASAYREAGVGRFFFHLHPAAQPQDEIRGWLAAEGLEKYRGWMKFTRGPTPPPAHGCDLNIREIGPEHAVDFGRIAGAGFGLSAQAAALPAALCGAPGWHLFMAFDGAHPAGTGALFVEDGIGWTDWGATDPDFRRRGCQTALLVARLDKAIALGCRMILTETGEEVPGDPQHSYRNILKVGFSEMQVRENWVPS